MTLNLNEHIFKKEDHPDIFVKELQLLGKKVFSIEKFLEESSRGKKKLFNRFKD